ncbi:hypothetical protein HK19_15530 [Acetobacter persici]|nr:hypothetical protein HK19_15530 [Acetobacter persici]
MLIPVHKTTMMQTITRAIVQGYIWHISGVVHAERAVGLVQKFETLYGVNSTAQQRWRGKKAGRASARLFLFPANRTPNFFWWLLFTDGETVAREREHDLALVTDPRKRLTWGSEFESVQVSGQTKQAQWTWRLTPKRLDEWRLAIKTAIRHSQSDGQIKFLVSRYQRLPGFRGVREQVSYLRHYTKSEWVRTRRGECSFLPKGNPPYVRLRSSPGVEIDLLIDRMLAGLPPFSDEIRFSNADKAQAAFIAAEDSWGDK